MAKILIVDDDSQLRKSFENLLREEGHEVLSAASGEEGCNVLEKTIPDLVVMDVRLPGISGLEAFQRIRKTELKLPVIIMTAFGTTDTAIEATKLGAFDYILKPFDIPEMFGIIDKALEAGRFMRTPVQMNPVQDVDAGEAMVGKSTAMQEVYKAIGRVAPTDTTVLVRGESGTGKELVARALYQHSLRCERPFLIINCVAIPETLLESELFGYEKGSFTGATRRRVGKVEQAVGGTLFLDEIGDMPITIQAKILRLLQEKTIERIGGGGLIQADVRIVAATNRNLEECVAQGLFREDLYYRLNVVAVNLPSLRERREDIPLLSRYFLEKISIETSMLNPGITDEAQDMLCGFSWPGNVRELSNTIQKALLFSRGGPIDADDISSIIYASEPERDSVDAETVIKGWVRQLLQNSGESDLFAKLNDRFAEIVIRDVLEHTQGNQTLAAKLLGLSRPTLQTKIEKYGLSIAASVRKESLPQ
jgi:nitrogen regulation protein NR(I)